MSFETTGSGFSGLLVITMRKYISCGFAGSIHDPRPNFTCSSNGLPCGVVSSRRVRTASFSFAIFFSSTAVDVGTGGGFAALARASSSWRSAALPAFSAARSSSAAFFAAASSAAESTVSDGGLSIAADMPPPTPIGLGIAAGGGTAGADALSAAATSDEEPSDAPPNPVPLADGADMSSYAGAMSAAWLTRSTLGITRRGRAA